MITPRALAAIALLLSGCAHKALKICGRLEPAAIESFHRTHALSVGANESSVEGLAAGDDTPDGGFTGWLVCVERGVATIQNHPTQQEIEMEWTP